MTRLLAAAPGNPERLQPAELVFLLAVLAVACVIMLIDWWRAR